MDAQGPSIPVGLDHFRFAGKVLVPVSHIPAAHLGLEITGIFDAVRWVHVDHLHFACQCLPAGKRGHDSERIPENEPIGPVHWPFIELDRLPVFLLGIEKEVPLGVLSLGHFQDRLGGKTFMNMKGYRIGHAPLLLSLAGPFQPWFMIPHGLPKCLQFLRLKLPSARFLNKLAYLISLACPIKPKRRRKVGVIGILQFPLPEDLPPRRQARRRDIQPRHPRMPQIQNPIPCSSLSLFLPGHS
jgi:hypothetical protein